MYPFLKCLIVKFPVSFDFQSRIWEINQVLINLILSIVLNIHVFINYTVFSPKGLECQIWISLCFSFAQSHLTVFIRWPFLAQKNSVEFQMTLYKLNLLKCEVSLQKLFVSWSALLTSWDNTKGHKHSISMLGETSLFILIVFISKGFQKTWGRIHLLWTCSPYPIHFNTKC